MDLKYKRASQVIILSKLHKEKRMPTITKWIEDQHCWELAVFSDKKRFSLDGPDYWRSYIWKSLKLYRTKRQCGGWSILVWILVLPSDLLSYRIVEGNLNFDKYTELLQTTAVSIMKLNYGEDIFSRKIIPRFINHEKLQIF